MKILLAADGSPFTQKALEFIVTHQSFSGADDELSVVNVQAPVPGRVSTMLRPAEVAAYHSEESSKVLTPIKAFLEQHGIRHHCTAVVGAVVEEIIGAAKKDQAQLIVMGTHGHGWLGLALLGSTTQRVIVESPIAVLLVK